MRTSDPTAPRPTTGPAAGKSVLALLAVLLALLLLAGSGGAAMAQSSQPRTVSFPSADGKTTLTGYLFAPAGRPKTAPAVVLLHGRTGAYSVLAKGNYSAVTIDKRIRAWAELWASQGYWALVVDSFGPRGYPGGLPASGDGKSPQATTEATVRPLDAYGALKYLRASPRVRADRIALQGWSNGATAALAAMSKDALPAAEVASGHGFRIGLALYPGCNLQARYHDGYVPYAPVHIFIGTRDEETSSATCDQMAAASHAEGAEVGITLLPGATHDFDDPAHEKPAANPPATAESRKQAEALLAAALR